MFISVNTNWSRNYSRPKAEQTVLESLRKYMAPNRGSDRLSQILSKLSLGGLQSLAECAGGRKLTEGRRENFSRSSYGLTRQALWFIAGVGTLDYT